MSEILKEENDMNQAGIPEYSPAELRRLMTERLNRGEIGGLWFDLFGTTLDSDLPGRSQSECVIELLARVNQRRRDGHLVALLRQSYTHLLEGSLLGTSTESNKASVALSSLSIGPADNWLDRLNAHFAGKVEVFGPIESEPKLFIEGPLQISEAEARVADQIRSGLRINDAVAVLTREPKWSLNPLNLYAQTTDYATVLALKQLKRPQILLSGNALVFCAESEELILHYRDEISSDQKDKLHTFGGAYMPDVTNGKQFDHSMLTNTAVRETWEEANINIDIINQKTKMLMIRESIGYVNLALIGVHVSKQQVDRAADNLEGRITRIKFSELLLKLRDPTLEWVPAGMAQVLSWLALGAPYGKADLKFGNKSGPDIFNEFVPSL